MSRNVKIYDIQPGEDFLERESINFFAKLSVEEILRTQPEIRLARTRGTMLNYFAIDGNNRIYVLYSRGIKKVLVNKIEVENSPEGFWSAVARQGHNGEKYVLGGVNSWEDLGKRIVSQSERDNFYHRVFGLRKRKQSNLERIEQVL